jgi:hypothetical protein
MKFKDLFRFQLIVLFNVLVIVIFTSYGNKKVHPDLNSLMVDAFLKQNNKGDFSQNDFKKYTFFFEQGVTLKGTAIIKDGLFSAGDVAAAGFGYGYSEEGPAEMTVKQWIAHGGYSADVPEVPASLRHFYDPTKPAGERYLTDITNAKIMGSLQKYVFTNPRIDGVEWALGKPGDHSTGIQDHQYTWERGKLWMQMALKETNGEKKNEYMALAWRSLGETLHMIADNGCPPHVRNDAHPSPLWNNNTWFGDPDPYEELVDLIRRDQNAEFISFTKGLPDPVFKDTISAMTRVEKIAHAMAVFTNTNFVSNETISGTDKYGNQIKQITHPEYPYPAPLLENLTYSETDYSYKTSAGVKQCIDHYYFAKMIPKMCPPYVDMECVKSQARVLLPNIIEAGKNVIKLFIPKLSVEIKSVDKNVLNGEIKHKINNEYPTEIKYTGDVILLIKDKNNREIDKITVQSKNGIFEAEGIKLSKDEKILARIEFGGITIESTEVMGVSDNILGLYEGKYSMQINEANLLQTRLSESGSQANTEMRDIVQRMIRNRVKTFISNVNWIKGGAQGGPIVKFDIDKATSMDNYYETTGLKFVVLNMSNNAFIPKVLTPLKDKSNTGTLLQCLSNGFCVVTMSGTDKITIKANFKGNDLVGNWTVSNKGKVLWTATFTARKTVDL